MPGTYHGGSASGREGASRRDTVRGARWSVNMDRSSIARGGSLAWTRRSPQAIEESARSRARADDRQRSGPMPGSILITVALAWEEAAVSRGALSSMSDVPGLSRLARGPWADGSAWLLRTGIGPEQAAAAVRRAIEVARPGVILSTGCAGALSSELRTGDVIVPDEIVSGVGAMRPTDGRWRDRYRRAAARAALTVREGRLFSSPRILLGPEPKRAAAERTGAIAVDMEAFAVAECGHAAGIAVAVARVVLDPLALALPAELPAITRSSGRPALARLIASVARRPGLIADLVRLARSIPKCRATLAALHREIARVPPDEEDPGEGVAKKRPVR